MKTIIIGGVAGGASAAARLRRLDEQAEILLIERGAYISFANCGLPYYIGGEIADREDLTLQTPESFRARFRVDVRVNSEAVRVDPDNKRVTVQDRLTGDTYQEAYDRLILSPGAQPVRPPIPGLDSPRVFTLRSIPDALRLKEFIGREHPRTAAVVGGGYIGVEMAENLSKAGLEVTIVEMADHLIAPLDADMAADVHHHLRRRGIRLRLGEGLQGVSGDGDELILRLPQGDLRCDLLLLSVGVRPESELAAACGIRVNARGSILVDDHMRTSAPHIYAVGDAVEVTDFVSGRPAFIPLAGPANKQGRIAADNIAGLDSAYTGTQGSAVVRVFDMTVATTGLNERTACAAGLPFDKTYLFAGSHASYYPGASSMSIKVLWDRESLRLLGAQIVGGDGVDKRLDVLATAIRFGGKVTDLAGLELCYAPPYGSAKDPVNMVGFVTENVATGKVRQFFHDEVDALPRDGSVTLLDVRTPAEHARGSIPGFVNIPLDSLRENLESIPKDRLVYVHCHSGQRSYVACRILTGCGYDCRNLAGGWRLYDAVARDKTAGKG